MGNRLDHAVSAKGAGLPGEAVKLAERLQPVANSIEFRLRRQQRERDVIDRGIRDRFDVALALSCFECGNDDRVRQSIEREMALAQRGEPD